MPRSRIRGSRKRQRPSGNCSTTSSPPGLTQCDPTNDLRHMSAIWMCDRLEVCCPVTEQCAPLHGVEFADERDDQRRVLCRIGREDARCGSASGFVVEAAPVRSHRRGRGGSSSRSRTLRCLPGRSCRSGRAGPETLVINRRLPAGTVGNVNCALAACARRRIADDGHGLVRLD